MGISVTKRQDFFVLFQGLVLNLLTMLISSYAMSIGRYRSKISLDLLSTKKRALLNRKGIKCRDDRCEVENLRKIKERLQFLAIGSWGPR